MNQVLSQSEVDALLAAVSDGEIDWYRFRESWPHPQTKKSLLYMI